MRGWKSFEDKRLSKLSKGQRRQFELDLALAWPAKLLVLDEPFDGLDPVARSESLERFMFRSSVFKS
jgi:ABC-2 type transport system ATP-binding protein